MILCSTKSLLIREKSLHLYHSADVWLRFGTAEHRSHRSDDAGSVGEFKAPDGINQPTALDFVVDEACCNAVL